MNKSEEEQQEKFWNQRYYWMSLNIIWYWWSLLCSWTSIAIKHPYLGFIGAMSGLGRQVGFEQFSSSTKQGEYDCGTPKERGVSKIKLTGNLNYHWDDGIPSLRQTIKQLFTRGLHESRNNMALRLC
tara:strand:- start:68 stop:448 length:381 start_codon:yes stop_codon:yes gene_type:complete